MATASSAVLSVRDYDLDATMTSGQVFRWQRHEDSWVGIVGAHWVRLRMADESILAESAGPMSDWDWLTHFLQIETDWDAVLASFPDDEPMRLAKAACRGLR